MLVISFSSVLGHAQDLRVVSYKELDKVIASSPDTLKIINFWATWCKPCVEELPYFVTAQKELKNKKVRFIFVSLDFISQTPKVKEMIQKLSMQGTLLQLNEPGGSWIDQLDKNWSGAIPYTLLILPNGEHQEHYDVFNNINELYSFINKNLPNTN